MLALRAALDEIEIGVVLLDGDMRSQFINKAFRRMWKLPDAKADAKIPFVGLMYHGRDTGAYEVPSDDLDAYVTARFERVKAGDIAPLDLRLKDGSVLRFQCAVLPNSGGCSPTRPSPTSFAIRMSWKPCEARSTTSRTV